MTRSSKGKILNRHLEDNLTIVGEQIRLARLRRNLTLEIVAGRATCSRATVAKVEKGDPTVAFGIYARVLNALQLADDLLLLAKDDQMGRLLQDVELNNRKRPRKKLD